MNIVKVISAKFDDTKRMLIKFLNFGKYDILEKHNSTPYGFESNPIKDMKAVYVKSEHNSEGVIIGYINVDLITDVGESRMFSTDDKGELKMFLHLKNDGTAEFGGDQKNLTRFQELKDGFDELKQDFNNHVDNWNAFATAYVPGSPTTPGTPPTALNSKSSTASIDDAKIDELKTL